MGRFVTLCKTVERGGALMLQIEADRIRPGDELLLSEDGEKIDPWLVVEATSSLLTIERGEFEIDLRPWTPDDGRLGPWPARARRWTSVATRRAVTDS